MKKRKQITSELKPDIIFEILLKVPLKSLLRFKSVSKQWCNQITDSVFARAHLLKHQEVTSFIIHICEAWNPRMSIIDVKEAEEANSRGELLKPLNIPLPTKHKVRFENCCDGILCASYINSSRILLWNPITKWTKEIDYPHKRDDVCQDSVGFGYDSSIEVYKVVRISSMHIEVMNLKSNIWRTVVVSNVIPRCGYTPVHLNGILYWKGYLSYAVIVGFDLKKEELRIVQSPPKQMKYEGYYNLTSFQDMLCVIRYCTKGYEIWHEIWAMKEESNWVKVFDFKPKLSGYISMCCIHEAVIFRRAITGSPPFIVIYRNGESYTSINVTNESECWFRGAYVGSLISPPN